MQNCNTVRKRALHYLAALKENGFTNELPLDQAKSLFSQILDIWDRTSIKAYFGVKAHTTKRIVQRMAIYRTTSTISNKDIFLTERFETSPGYLEKMGLVSYEMKGKTWFMKLESPSLVPQLGKVVGGFISNFSLSPYSSENIENESEAKRNDSYNILETKQQLQNEREKTGGVQSEEETLAVEYLNILAEAGRKEASK
jgi:hypothetical protein